MVFIRKKSLDFGYYYRTCQFTIDFDLYALIFNNNNLFHIEFYIILIF